MPMTSKALVRHNGKYLVLKQVRLIGVSCWENPGGRSDPGELPEDTLLREVFEETGLHITIDQLIEERTMSANGKEWRRFLYLCSSESDQVTLSWEHSAYRWCTVEELETLENAPRIQDDLLSYKDFLTKMA